MLKEYWFTVCIGLNSFLNSSPLFAVAEGSKGLDNSPENTWLGIKLNEVVLWNCQRDLPLIVCSNSTRPQVTSSVSLCSILIADIWSSAHTFANHYTIGKTFKVDAAFGRVVLQISVHLWDSKTHFQIYIGTALEPLTLRICRWANIQRRKLPELFETHYPYKHLNFTLLPLFLKIMSYRDSLVMKEL